jgi:hypothetical protein
MSNNNTMTMTDALPLIEDYIAERNPVFIWGAPGIGKSEGVQWLGKKLKCGVTDFRASLRDPVDLKGMPWVDIKAMTTKWLIPDELPNEKRDGKTGILFMDELNIASQAMMGACFGLVLERRVGNYVLPDGWTIIAAGNRVSDRASAQRLPSALRNRFAHVTIEPDLDAWLVWATANGIDPAVCAFLRFRREAGMLHRMPKSDDENAFPTPRAWVKAAKFVDRPAPRRQRLFEGLVGEGAAAELEGFLRIYQTLPSIDQILSDPTGVHVPDMGNPAALYAVAGALARRADANNIGNVFKYAKRMPREFENMMAHDIAKRDPKLKSTKGFVDFAIRAQDVVL